MKIVIILLSFAQKSGYSESLSVTNHLQQALVGLLPLIREATQS
jgi:hypothetical protein